MFLDFEVVLQMESWLFLNGGKQNAEGNNEVQKGVAIWNVTFHKVYIFTFL